MLERELYQVVVDATIYTALSSQQTHKDVCCFRASSKIADRLR